MLGQSRFATTRRIGGAERTMIQQITRNDPPVGWAAQGIDGPIRAHATITIEPVDDATHTSHLHPRLRGSRTRCTPGPPAPAGAEGRPEQLPEPQKPPGERAVAEGGIRHCVEHCDLLLGMAPSKSDR